MSGRHQRGLVAAAATLLASAPLAAIYEEWGWLVRSALVVGVITAAALAARALRAPIWVQVVAMLAAWTTALTWQFPSGEEVIRFLPGTATIQHFGTLLGRLPADVREHATPVPNLESLLLVTVAGVGLVAILVDVFVAGLRRPALAGLPMLAIYSVPVAVSYDSVPLLLFAIGASGYLWLVASDNIDRVRRFGRRFTGDGRDVAAWAPSPLAAAGRRLAVVGVLVAVVLPLGIPGMTDGLVDRFGPGFSGGPGTGGSGQMNLFAQLHGQLNQDETVDLIRLTADDPTPFYLRIATADQITGTGFEPSPPAGRPLATALNPVLPAIPGVTYHRHRAEVELTDAYTMSLVPIYPTLVGVERLGGGWRFDEEQQVVFSTRQSAVGLRYAFDYARSEYEPDALRQAAPLPAGHPIQQRYSSAPEVPEVRALLDDLLDHDASPYDQVREILAFFSRTNGFRYDLETGPATDAPAIVDFLEHRVGFCVQYAAAMAWLVRSMDLPARVAFGFTRGTRSGDSRVLTNRNMHAWTEVYFAGFGWVPFDPTPGAQVAGSTTTEWAPSPDAPPGSNDPGGPGQDGQTPGAPAPGDNSDDSPMPSEDPDLGSPIGPEDSGWPWFGIAAALAVLLVLALPGIRRAALRRQRLASRPPALAAGPPPPPGTVVAADATAAVRHHTHAVWDELLDTMVDLRLPLDLSETPRATAQRLARHLTASAEAYRASRLLGQAEERARYARTPQPPEGLAAALRTLRRQLRASSTPAVRLRAVLLPPSTLLRWRQATADTMARTLAAGNRIAQRATRLSPRRLLRPAR